MDRYYGEILKVNTLIRNVHLFFRSYLKIIKNQVGDVKSPG